MSVRDIASRTATLKCEIDLKRAELKSLNKKMDQMRGEMKSYFEENPQVGGVAEVIPDPVTIPGRGQVQVNAAYTITNSVSRRLPPINRELLTAALTSYCAEGRGAMQHSEIPAIVARIEEYRASLRRECPTVAFRRTKLPAVVFQPRARVTGSSSGSAEFNRPHSISTPLMPALV